MNESKNLWIDKPEYTMFTGQSEYDDKTDEKRDAIYKEHERIKREAKCINSGWTEYCGYHNVYEFENGRKAVFEDNMDYGTNRIYFESKEDCKSDAYFKIEEQSISKKQNDTYMNRVAQVDKMVSSIRLDMDVSNQYE